MKVLIWFCGILVYVLIATAIRMDGFILGGLPTAILYFLTVGYAGILANKWGNSNKNKSHSKNVYKAYKKAINSKSNNHTCLKCGTKVLENATFCTKCGAKLQRNVCKKCGTKMQENATVCPLCGAEN